MEEEEVRGVIKVDYEEWEGRTIEAEKTEVDILRGSKRFKHGTIYPI